MKKMLFLMLFLLILGAANVTSQVRIGGNGVPNGAAVLDLNATDATINGTKGLALPRVSLASTTDQLGYTTLLNGMLVYNASGSLSTGVYYWDTNKWVKVSDGAFVEKDSIVGNEVANATANGGLERAGAGTASDPYTLGLPTSGITKGMVVKFDGTKWVAAAAPDTAINFNLDSLVSKSVGYRMTIWTDRFAGYDPYKCSYVAQNAMGGWVWWHAGNGLVLEKRFNITGTINAALIAFCFKY